MNRKFFIFGLKGEIAFKLGLLYIDWFKKILCLSYRVLGLVRLDVLSAQAVFRVEELIVDLLIGLSISSPCNMDYYGDSSGYSLT